MADASLHLIAWPKATDLALEIYRATPRVPKDELYGLTSQMRRAAVSVASNIAAGIRTLLPQGICAVPASCSGFPARTRNSIVHSKRTALSRTPRIPQNGRQNERAGTNPEWPNKQCSRGNQRRVLRAERRELRASFSVQWPLSPRDANPRHP